MLIRVRSDSTLVIHALASDGRSPGVRVYIRKDQTVYAEDDESTEVKAGPSVDAPVSRRSERAAKRSADCLEEQEDSEKSSGSSPLPSTIVPPPKKLRTQPPRATAPPPPPPPPAKRSRRQSPSVLHPRRHSPGPSSHARTTLDRDGYDSDVQIVSGPSKRTNQPTKKVAKNKEVFSFDFSSSDSSTPVKPAKNSKGKQKSTSKTIGNCKNHARVDVPTSKVLERARATATSGSVVDDMEKPKPRPKPKPRYKLPLKDSTTTLHSETSRAASSDEGLGNIPASRGSSPITPTPSSRQKRMKTPDLAAAKGKSREHPIPHDNSALPPFRLPSVDTTGNLQELSTATALTARPTPFPHDLPPQAGPSQVGPSQADTSQAGSMGYPFGSFNNDHTSSSFGNSSSAMSGYPGMMPLPSAFPPNTTQQHQFNAAAFMAAYMQSQHPNFGVGNPNAHGMMFANPAAYSGTMYPTFSGNSDYTNTQQGDAARRAGRSDRESANRFDPGPSS